MKKLPLGLIFLSLLFSIYSCEKEDLSLYKGSPGEEGAIGDKGDEGTGFEMIIKDFNVPYQLWNNSSAEVAVPELTQAFVDSGIVACYIFAEDGLQALPYRYWSRIGGYQIINFKVKAGEVSFNYLANFALYFQFNPTEELSFRLVAAKGFADNKQAIHERIAFCSPSINPESNTDN